LHLKTAVSGSSRRSAGREFHTDGPMTAQSSQRIRMTENWQSRWQTG